MWIAFNLLFSPQRKQHDWLVVKRLICCELLSIYYFRPSENNNISVKSQIMCVVNCFQFIIFAPAKTTSAVKSTANAVLWIAFNLLFSPQRKQPRHISNKPFVSCELLSIYYFRPSENNMLTQNGFTLNVVNCFQFIIFAPAKTTSGQNLPRITLLWIAFNLLFSPQRKQLNQSF